MLSRFWALSDDTLSALESAAHSSAAPTAAERRDILAAASSKITERRGVTAEIKIEGVLTARPDPLAMIFGGGNTTYAQIRDALQRADRDPDVRRVLLAIDSPGGEVRGLFELLAAIRTVKKPITVSASLAASAAYAIAAVAGKIEATSAAATFGSIGVAASFWTSNWIVDITSTNAPAKRPDVKTEAGRAMVRRQLDDIHELFVEEVARGRGVSVDRVNTDYGRGAVVLGREAQRLGMIDSIAKPGGPEAGSEEWAARALLDRMLPGAARAPSAPAGDLGDEVVAILRSEREHGEASSDSHVVRDSSEPASGSGDLGDQVVAELEREHVVSAPATPAGARQLLDTFSQLERRARAGADLGDDVVRLLRGHG